MNIKNNGLSCEQAKELDLVDYLRHLGFEPTRISQPSYWFRSPFRTAREKGTHGTAEKVSLSLIWEEMEKFSAVPTH